MAERVVSVKLPASLLDQLERLRAEHHYLDLSEQLRSIVRRKCLEYTNPYAQEVKRLRSDLEQQAAQQRAKSAREELLQELMSMLREGKR